MTFPPLSLRSDPPPDTPFSPEDTPLDPLPHNLVARGSLAITFFQVSHLYPATSDHKLAHTHTYPCPLIRK